MNVAQEEMQNVIKDRDDQQVRCFPVERVGPETDAKKRESRAISRVRNVFPELTPAVLKSRCDHQLRAHMALFQS
eukprot:SAG31_NODE_3238_length_4507_cov_14.674682_3_plen_75_part_00